MSIVKRIIVSLLLVGCIAGAAFVALQTAFRPSPNAAGSETPSSQPSTTATTSGNTVNTFPIGNTKNPFVPLAQLPATATTQPK